MSADFDQEDCRHCPCKFRTDTWTRYRIIWAISTYGDSNRRYVSLELVFQLQLLSL